MRRRCAWPRLAAAARRRATAARRCGPPSRSPFRSSVISLSATSFTLTIAFQLEAAGLGRGRPPVVLESSLVTLDVRDGGDGWLFLHYRAGRPHARPISSPGSAASSPDAGTTSRWPSTALRRAFASASTESADRGPPWSDMPTASAS